MGRVIDASLQERELAIELNAVDLKRRIGNAEMGQAPPVEIALISKIVNGQDRRNALPAPGKVRGCESLGPIVEVQKIGAP